METRTDQKRSTRIKTKLPPPNDLLELSDDYPFTEWYPSQDIAAQHGLDFLKSDKRFCGWSIPTGGGKSVLAQIVAKHSNLRTVYLTSTIALQDQVYRDFAPLGMVLMMGQNRFQCISDMARDDTFVNAADGPCHEGYNCPHKSMDCPYYARLRQALRSKLVITNYHYYLAQTYFSDGLGDIGLTICDEGHLAKDALESHLAVTLGRDELESAGIPFPDEGHSHWGGWRKWAKAQVERVADISVQYKADIQELRDSEYDVPASLSRAFKQTVTLERKLKSIGDSFGDWVWEKREGKSHSSGKWATSTSWKMTPVWIASYTHPRLFRDVPKIIVMSAVLTEKATRVLGIPKDEMDFLEMPSYFPKENNPIYHVPTVRMNYHTTEDDLVRWVSRIDQVISKRLDRKGIIFTVSYRRAQFIIEHSRYANIMMTHKTRDVIEKVRQFKRSKAPKILVSPAVTTGFDFPGRECSYTIIGKLPYPGTEDLVIKARQEIDDSWTSWMAMDALVQEVGRGFRGPKDTLEAIIVDDSWYWYWRRYKDMAPEWFQERVLGTIDVIPDPPSLNGGGD